MVDVLILSTQLFVFLILLTMFFSLTVVNFSKFVCDVFPKKTRIKAFIVGISSAFLLVLTIVTAIGVE